MCVGDLIRQKRQELNLSQEELGRMVGVNRAAINKWESGRVKNLKRETLKKLSEIFNISPALLVEPESATPIVDLAEKERRLITAFRELNATGQKKALTYISDLIDSGKYASSAPTVGSDIGNTLSLGEGASGKLHTNVK